MKEYSNSEEYSKQIENTEQLNRDEFHIYSENILQQEFGSQQKYEYNEQQQDTVNTKPKKSKFKKMMQYFVAGVAGASIIFNSINTVTDVGTLYHDIGYDGERGFVAITGTGEYIEGQFANIVKEDICVYEADIGFIVEYVCDEDGYIIESTQYYPDYSIYCFGKYEYDEQKKPIRSSYYLADGTFFEWVEFEYDKSTNSARSILYDSQGNIKYVGEYVYDDKGRPIKRTYYKEDGKKYFWYEREYQ